ncbi:MAG TPA: nitrilase-related carbon-nitrogen hydrolase, partial [Gammaproteobacteria bacterium]|nr:nitrilase-related carbon-nitrogen hydrolase [Gammaproteobacteria bacterium]
MASPLRMVMAQLDFLVGDLSGNVERIIAAALEARDELGAQAVVFPELAVTGYPPEDLLLRNGFHLHVLAGLERIKRDVRGIHVIVGHPHHDIGGLFNAASVIRDGQILATCRKQHLPNYSVFDEKRYFAPGQDPCVVEIAGVPVGVSICEDIWMPGPAEQARNAGARLLVNLNASPFHSGKGRERESVVRQRVTETGIPVVYVNLVGGQDELVFDGESFVMDAGGEITHRAPPCIEGLYPVDFEAGEAVRPRPGEIAPALDEEASIYEVLVLGVRDYIRKNGFKGAVVGLSGGIDSALTLAIAADAIGGDQVEAVLMPSRYTSDMSIEDA